MVILLFSTAQYLTGFRWFLTDHTQLVAVCFPFPFILLLFIAAEIPHTTEGQDIWGIVGSCGHTFCVVSQHGRLCVFTGVYGMRRQNCSHPLVHLSFPPQTLSNFQISAVRPAISGHNDKTSLTPRQSHVVTACSTICALLCCLETYSEVLV